RIIWNLKSLPNELADLLTGLDEETLRWRPRPDKWSIKEIMCHLRDMESEAYLARYLRILSEDNPLLPNIDQDRLAAERDYINQDARAALEDFKRTRAITVNTLEAAPVDAFSRAGVHETAGRLTIEQLIERQIKGNDLNHLSQMKDILALRMPWKQE
ncbi:MAG: DinB family protein, partial [Acidobacteriota bacterium]